MLIRRKVIKDEGVVTEFRYLNIRIVKNNLAYPLLKDTFSLLGSYRCNSFVSVRFQRCILFLRAFGKFKDSVESYPILALLHIYIKEYLWD